MGDEKRLYRRRDASMKSKKGQGKKNGRIVIVTVQEGDKINGSTITVKSKKEIVTTVIVPVSHKKEAPVPPSM